jgi:hypothetical protein
VPFVVSAIGLREKRLSIRGLIGAFRGDFFALARDYRFCNRTAVVKPAF